MQKTFFQDLSPKQLKALKFLSQNDRAIELLYGGAKGGGKSWLAWVFAFLECHRLIDMCNIKASEHPILVGFIGRKIGKQFKNTTLETLFKVVPGDAYRIVGKPATIIIDEKVKINTGGLDRSEDVQKFNSAELAFYIIDQAEECAKNDLMVLKAATFWRLTINGVKIPGKGLLTANPRQCWLKYEFVEKRKDGDILVSVQ